MSTYIVICKRNRALLAKMSAPYMSCSHIGVTTGCCRNFLRWLIHKSNKEVLDLFWKLSHRQDGHAKSSPHMNETYVAFENAVPKYSSEVMALIEKMSDVKISVSHVRQLLHRLGYGFRKVQPVPRKVDADKQVESIKDLQPIIEEIKKGIVNSSSWIRRSSLLTTCFA